MDEITFRTLDFQYILDRIEIMTPYGHIYKDKMRAFIEGEEEELKKELDEVERFKNLVKDEKFTMGIRDLLINIKDLRNSIRRAQRGGVLTDVELFELKNFFMSIRRLKNILDEKEKEIAIDYNIEPLEELEALLDPENTSLPTFYIYDAYSEELKNIRQEVKCLQSEIDKKRDTLKKKVEEELNIRINTDGTTAIPKDKKDLVEKLKDYPYLVYLGENYMTIKYALKPTDEIDILNKKIQILKGKEEKEEEHIREKLSSEIKKQAKRIWKNIAGIGRLDLVIGKADLALKINGIKPNITYDHVLIIKNGRHPKVEVLLRAKSFQFKPISVQLKRGVTCITGANMGGKTVSLKLIGLLTAMAQHGLLVPAEEMALGLNNFIRKSIEDSQSIDRGLSAFGGEIRAVKQAIDLSDNRGLILIDELAKGTNPEEGYAISKAIVEYLLEKESITVVTTHYDNVANTEGVLHLQVVGLSNADFEELENKIIHSHEDPIEIINSYMDYGLIQVDRNAQVPKDAINIARIMGLDLNIIELAEKNLKGKAGYIGKARIRSKAY